MAIDSVNSYFTTCNNDNQGTLVATSNNPNVSYTWSTGQATDTINGLAGGLYTVYADIRL